MPTGIYKRSAEMKRRMRANLAMGHTKAAREKAAGRLREIASNPEWRLKVSAATTLAMHRPEVRARHLAGLARVPGNNFSGGNGQTPALAVRSIMPLMEKLGFIREKVISTSGHGTKHTPPPHYKVDFGDPRVNLAVEMDGPYHRLMRQRVKDKKKDQVLKALGWTVIRIPHR